jgi:K+ transporter
LRRKLVRHPVDAGLRQAREQGCSLDPDDVTYYVARETIIHRGDGKGLAEWEEALFAAMERNAVHVSDFFSLPLRRARSAQRNGFGRPARLRSCFIGGDLSTFST